MKANMSQGSMTRPDTGRIVACFAVLAGALLLLSVISAPVTAQVVYGSMSGTVKDAQGGVIPGASVTLISGTRGVSMAPALTNESGHFLFPNVGQDTYTVRVESPGFKTLQRSGVTVSSGTSADLGTLTLEVGGLTEIVTVTGDATPLQLTTSEQSLTLTKSVIESLPLSGNNYLNILNNLGGISGTAVIGGAGDTNFQVDGVTAMEIGANRSVNRMSVQAVGEVRVVQSGYDAEYGRSAGLQFNAITKSGTNQYHGSFYLLERRPQWSEKSKTAILNGDPKTGNNARDWGWTIGGPIGKPGGQNKLFFFYNQEFNPRTEEGTVTRYRVPTLLERQGDFSQTLDNNGNLYPYIKDPTITGTCSASNQTACFKDGGVLGKIPANRLYQAGLNVLKWWPEPTLPTVPGVAYNWENVMAKNSLLGWEPVIRIDYQPSPKLGISGKYIEYQQQNPVIAGLIPGWNDTRMDNYGIWMGSVSVNWTASATTFVEGSWGSNWHHQEGCNIYGGEPTFCRGGIYMTKYADRRQMGMADIPDLYPNANIINPKYTAYPKFERVKPANWDGSRLYLTPSFSWGSRIGNSPPSMGFNSSFIHTTQPTESINVTRIIGPHTVKAGFYGIQGRGPRIVSGGAFPSINMGNDSNNPIDSQFGFANAALGIFSSYSQQSSFPEGGWTYLNTEWYVQDSWRMKSNLTVNYGLRFVAQQPAYDNRLQFANFLPDKYKISDAPAFYMAGCANGVNPCSGTNRQAMNPLTGQFLGPNTTAAIGGMVPNTGNPMNGLFLPGKGIAKTAYTHPLIAVAPRMGFAWNVGGQQKLAVRGGAGLFFDRVGTNMLYGIANNPPTGGNRTVRYGFLQNFGAALNIDSPSSIHAIEYKAPLNKTFQWNLGMQMSTPLSTMLDVTYSANHAWDVMVTGGDNVNSIDYGTGFLASNQDLTQTSTTPGAASFAALNPNYARPMRGYGPVVIRQTWGWSTFHSIMVTISRRLKNNIGFYFNDMITLYSSSRVAPRYQHAADGSYTLRSDQQQAQDLLGGVINQRHLFKANFDWSLPQIKSKQSGLRAVGLLLNGWQLTGTWTGSPGTPYTIGYSYTSNGANVNITGSPDFNGRIILAGDPGRGCSSDTYRQFSTSAFAGPQTGSVGLESGGDYLRGCFTNSLNLAISRNIRLERGINIQLRVDMFNAPNLSTITGRNTTVQYASPATATTPTNLPFDSAGNLIATRSLPKNAGFGVANNYLTPRSIQAQIKLTF